MAGVESFPQRVGTSDRRQRLELVAVFFLAGLYLLSQMIPLYRSGALFWDAQVYDRGIRAYLAGQTPYVHLPQLNFVYSPLFLHIGAPLYRAVPFRLVAVIYGLLNCAAACLLPVVLVLGYLRSSWFTLPAGVALFFCHPRMTGTESLLSGNMSNLLYAAVLAAGIPGVRRNRWLPLYLAVGVAAVIKPTILCLLLLPPLLGAGQYLGSAVTAVLLIGEKLLEKLLWPAEYKAFVESVSFQVLTLKDNGIGLTRYFVHFHLGSKIPLLHDNLSYLLHFAVMGAIVAAMWLARKRRGVTIPEPIWISMVLVMAILASPRILVYDVDVAILPATLLVAEAVAAALQRRMDPLFLVLPLGAFGILLVRSETAAVFFYLLSSALLFVAGLYRRPAPPTSGFEAIN